MDYNKMKVNDLKAELAARNLDTKGVKAVLVERLKEAIEKESTGSTAESTPILTGTKKIEVGTPNQSTPIRRSRRRSMTRSPSPTKVEPSALESVVEASGEAEDLENTRKKRRTRSITKSPSPPKMVEVKRLEAVEEETELSDKTEETDSKNKTETLTPNKQHDKTIESITIEKQVFSEITIQDNTTTVSSNITTPKTVSPENSVSTVQQCSVAPAKSNSISVVTPPKLAATLGKISSATTRDASNEHKSTIDTPPEIKDSKAITDKVCLTKDETENESSKATKRKSTSPGKDSPTKAPRTKPDQTSIEFDNMEVEPIVNENENFTLSWYDSHLNLEIDNVSCYKAKPLNDGAFGLLWAGARANFGVERGKYAYEVLLACTNNTHKNTDEPITNEFRVGWSIGEANLQLGEDMLSFGYCSTGTKATDCKFEQYGSEYKTDDVIGVYLDLDSNPCTIEYTVNNVNQGVAFKFQKSDLNGKALFPHVCSKNIAFTVNFGQFERSLLNKDHEANLVDPKSEKLKSEVVDSTTTETETTANPDDTSNKESEQKKKKLEEKPEKSIENEFCINSDYDFIAKSPKEDLVRGICSPANRKDCEVIFLIGLPGSGKTHWVQKYLKENLEKKYVVLNTEALLDQMTVLGEPRRPSNTIKWSKLIESLARSLNKLNEIAKTRRRNVIIDQTNVFFSEQKRRVRGFGGFATRKAVVVVPEEEEYKRRFKLKEDKFGPEIQENNLINMKAHMYIPVLEHGWFTEINFVEMNEENTREAVKKLNEDFRKLVKSNKNRVQRRGNNDKQQWNQGNRYNNKHYQQSRYNPQQRYNTAQNRNYRLGSGYGRNDSNYDGSVRFRNQNDWMRNSGRYNRSYQGTIHRRYDGNRNDYRASRGYSGGWNQPNANCWSYGSYQGNNDYEEFNSWWQSNVKNLLQQHGADNNAQHASMEQYWSHYAQQHNYGNSGSSSRNK